MANIANLLANIKNAIFGKDVRNSIHDAIKQCYDDAIANGHTDMEVAKARGKYNELAERLNDTESELRLEKNRIDNITQLKEGSTTGDAELTDVRIDYEGHEFENAGNAVREQIIEIIKKTFVRTENLYDKDNEVVGKYINNQNGHLSNHPASLYNKRYIGIVPGNTYYYNSAFTSAGQLRVAYYNINKEFLSGNEIDKTGGTIIAPENAYFMRINTYSNLNISDDFMIMDHVLPASYVPYNLYIKSKIPMFNEMLEEFAKTNNSIKELTDSVFKFTDNLFNKDHIILGYYINPTSTKPQVQYESSYNEDYISVTSGQTYYFNESTSGTGQLRIHYYNSNYEHISVIQIDKLGGFVIIPENVVYCRLSAYGFIFNDDFMFMNKPIPANFIPYCVFNLEKLDLKGSEFEKETERLKDNQSQLIKNLYFKDVYTDHLFINLIGGTNQVIPAESLENLRVAKKLGFKITEASLHRTSDNKWLVLHGEKGKFGTQVVDLNGEYTYQNTNINSVTMDFIKQNIRYRSTIEKYRVAPPTFEEWLQECKVLQLIPHFQGSLSSDLLEIANKIVGKGNYISWGGSREEIPGFITISDSGDVQIADYYVNKCDEKGLPAMIYVTPSKYTDSQLKDIVEALHKKGYLVAWTSCYATVDDTQRALKAGFDFSVSAWDIPDIDNGNLCNLTDDIMYTDFNTNGSVSNGILYLTNNQVVRPSIDLSALFLGGGSLRINFEGTLHIKMGRFIDAEITSDAELSNWFSTYFIQEIPTFILTAVGNVKINSITYMANKC